MRKGKFLLVMRQPRKLVRGRAGILVLGALAVALVLATVPFVLAKAFSISPTLTEGITLREAYDLAANATRAWQNDAVLYSLNSVEDEEPFMAAAAAKGLVLGDQGRRASWNVDFFSPGTGMHYNVLLRDGKIFRTRPFDNPPPEFFLDVTNLAFDSPAALRIAQDCELKPGSGRWALTGYHFSLSTAPNNDEQTVLVVRGADQDGHSAQVHVNGATGQVLARLHEVFSGGNLFRLTRIKGVQLQLNGPTLQSGVCTLALPPDYDRTPRVYAGTIGNAIWSEDGGASWSNGGTGISPGAAVFSLAFSPSFADDRTLFAGTSDGRLFRSMDAGLTWQAADLELYSDGWPIYAIVLSPSYAQDHSLYVGTYGNGLYMSTDGGETWTAANEGLTNPRIRALALVEDNQGHSILFAGTDKGLFASMNGARSWERRWINELETTSVSAHVNTIIADLSSATVPTIYIGLASHGVYRSTDGGEKWFRLGVSPRATGGEWTVGTLAISPRDPQVLYSGAARSGLCISSDGGMEWWIPISIPQSVDELVVLPDRQETALVVDELRLQQESY